MVLRPSIAHFLQQRGIGPANIEITRLEGGEANSNWKISSGLTSWVLRQYPEDSATEEIDYELSAVDRLAGGGFPTPAPLPSRGSPHCTLWEIVDGQATALFPFIEGHHPETYDDGYSSPDLGTGLKAARLVARMHTLLDGSTPHGHRSSLRDPWRRVERFLSSDLHRHEAFRGLIEPLRECHSRLAHLYGHGRGLPAGLVHNDVNPGNILLSEENEIIALLDFDDSAHLFLIYELAALVSSFGVNSDHRIDVGRAQRIIGAFSSERPLTDEEHARVPLVLATHAAAEALEVVDSWRSQGINQASLKDSFSVRQLFDLLALGDRIMP